MNHRPLHLTLSIMIIFAFTFVGGCATPEEIVKDGIDSGIESAMRRPSNDSESRRSGQSSSTRGPSPGSPGWSQYMVSHARIAFSHTFAPGGIWLNHGEFQPGEWVRYEFRGLQDNDVVTVERALLKVRDDGKEWWRVEWAHGGDRWIYEGLVDPNSQELLRLKAKGPRGEANEVPVERGTRVFQSPRKLTEESIRGATVGTESVTVGGRSYSARHVRYGTMGQGTIEWWIHQDVPGGLVKYQISDNQNQGAWTSQLIGHGTGSSTQLGVY